MCQRCRKTGRKWSTKHEILACNRAFQNWKTYTATAKFFPESFRERKVPFQNRKVSQAKKSFPESFLEPASNRSAKSSLQRASRFGKQNYHTSHSSSDRSESGRAWVDPNCHQFCLQFQLNFPFLLYSSKLNSQNPNFL